MFDKSYEDLMKTPIGEVLDTLTDYNWHTERCLIEAILSGDSELIDDMLVVAIHHHLAGFLKDEMCDLRKKASNETEEILHGKNDN